MSTSTLRQSPSGPPIALDSDDIENVSNVPGTTVSDALDSLSGALPANSNDIVNVSAIPGANLTQALDQVADPVTTARLASGAGNVTTLSGAVYSSQNGANQSTTNSAAEIVCGTLVIPANTSQVGDTYRFRCHWFLTHTATPDPNVQVILRLEGAAFGTRFLVPQSVAGTYAGSFEIYFRVTALGSPGACTVCLSTSNDASFGIVGNLGSGGFDSAFTTTLNRNFSFNVQMVTAVPGNTLTVDFATIEKLITS